MRIRDLIEQLEDLAHDHGDATDVRFAMQPSWPFEYAIQTVTPVTLKTDGGTVVYLGEGRQLGYLPQEAAVALEWAEPEDDEDDDDCAHDWQEQPGEPPVDTCSLCGKVRS